ncbi:cytochrome c biogenesis CcdA family protein [Pseudotabrizicola alkalilacus]|uniref:Cytochrome c biogenesis protein CcdA n=1 Tax=Pseudotabrizicola alkalilacus TaxID=2305252 RepID=A0A411Z0L4_9RHOB|nr:cytochrome c biogenesis CcdA family protein [Pseudotabrizicola alkalilacus]RGP36596.1 cytochrome c biogenesis protein CcdA [Pseudotabrizicola alkalilacus]
MELIFAYLAGLLTLINPCVLPVLPIVLASSLHRDQRAPIALAAGMSLSFVVLGLGVTAIGPALGLDTDSVAHAAALAMVGFGLVMLVPALSGRFSTATAGIAARADARIDTTSDAGLGGQVLSGALLGAVWSPCIGPTLGAAIALASTGENLWRAGAIMTAFAFGVSTLIMALAYGAKSAIRKRQALLRTLAERAKPVMGVTFIAVGLALWFGLHHVIERWLNETLPVWLIDFSVSI